VEYLLNSGADVHAKDKGGLVPLHNACSYGHYEVSRNGCEFNGTSRRSLIYFCNTVKSRDAPETDLVG
jgi:ankyrin repeat protein